LNPRKGQQAKKALARLMTVTDGLGLNLNPI
jgi:hypothetical protein